MTEPSRGSVNGHHVPTTGDLFFRPGQRRLGIVRVVKATSSTTICPADVVTGNATGRADDRRSVIGPPPGSHSHMIGQGNDLTGHLVMCHTERVDE